jgi:ABC-type transport system involved in multi-copper enzyme maturation permease subunit
MSTDAPAAAAAAAPPPPAGYALDEFSDRISPMLVKELRQGLRAKTFVIVFLALQALLAVVLLSAIGASSSDSAGQRVSNIIFFFFSLAVLIVQPLRGIGALHNEIKGNTIDLMVLTRLGAWRIVLGKWVSIVSQSALLLTAIAPYLILRYFFGRMNLFAELNLLLLIFLSSALFTAITVGLSAIPSIIIRGLLPLVIAFYLGIGIFAVTFDSRDGFSDLIEFCSLQETNSGWALLAGLVTAAYFGWSALALAASMIAPMAENHSTVRRLLTLAAVAGFALIAAIASFPRESIGPILLLFCAPAIAIAVTEPLQLLPPICRPFLRFGTAGKLAGRFLYPGWPSGVLFSGLLIALGCAVVLQHLKSGGTPGWAFDAKFPVLLLGSLGTLLMPGLLIRLLPGRIPRTFTLYILFLGIIIATAVGLDIVQEEVEGANFMWAFAWIPPVQFNLMNLINRDYYDSLTGPGIPTPSAGPDYQPLVLTGVATCAIYYLGMLIFALRSFHLIREVETEAATPTRSAP